MAVAQEKALSAATNPIEWFDDFTMAVRSPVAKLGRVVQNNEEV
jgi:hypothetical protein